jgi:twitching motility protein PilT
MPDIKGLLTRCVENNGSDLHFKTDTGAVYLRKYGDLLHWDDVPKFDSDEFMRDFKAILRPDQMEKFVKTQELDFSLEIPNVARFRGNMYQQRSHPQAVFRVIPFHIQTME